MATKVAAAEATPEGEKKDVSGEPPSSYHPKCASVRLRERLLQPGHVLCAAGTTQQKRVTELCAFSALNDASLRLQVCGGRLVRVVAQVRLVQARHGVGQGALYDCHPAAQRYRRAAHRPRAHQLCAGACVGPLSVLRGWHSPPQSRSHMAVHAPRIVLLSTAFSAKLPGCVSMKRCVRATLRR